MHKTARPLSSSKLRDRGALANLAEVVDDRGHCCRWRGGSLGHFFAHYL
jgi:hypothetical protein